MPSGVAALTRRSGLVLAGMAVAVIVGVLAIVYSVLAPRPPMRFDHPIRSGPKDPLAVYIHGGGWVTGDRLSDAYYKSVKAELLAQGVAVASIDYGLAPKHRFPPRYKTSPTPCATCGPTPGSCGSTPTGSPRSAPAPEVTWRRSLARSTGRRASTSVPFPASPAARAVADIVVAANLTDPSFPQVTRGGDPGRVWTAGGPGPGEGKPRHLCVAR